MALTAKLMNPTPWPVKIDWDRGVKIRVPAFGDTALAMQQMDDFRANKPGSEAVQSTLDYHGLFLLDSDRPYDNQALDALERSYRSKKFQYDEAVKNLRDRRAAAGVAPNEEALEETLRMQGLVTLRNKVETLANQIKALREVVGEDRTVRQQFDPKRTVFVLDPPREFPSVSQMEFFLDLPENSEIKQRHEAFVAQSRETEATKLPTTVTGAK